MRGYRSSAFSLAELLITLCLLAILSSLAFPSWSRLIASNRQETLKHLLLSHLHAARSTAIVQRQRVEFCGSRDGATCDQAWDQGWLTRSAQSREKLQFFALPNPPSLYWIGAGTGSQSITYQHNGITLGNNGRFVLCSKDREVVWQIVINRQGRVRQLNGIESGQQADRLCR